MVSPPTQPRILAIEDNEPNLRLIQKVLNGAGFSDVRILSDSRRALAQIQEFRPDLLILDLHMPHLDGFEILDQVRHRKGESEYLPVLVISGEPSTDAKQRALAEGATDFLTKPYDPAEVVLRVRNLLKIRDLMRHLHDVVRERTDEVRRTHVALADRLALAAELRGHSRGFHTRRVGRIAGLIAAELGLPDMDVELITLAAPLHDIGMIGIPDSIVLKRGELTLEEWDVLKTHTVLGARLLSGSDSPVLQMGEEIALYHHENWDGTGYSPGLAGEEIPLPARITALADVFDALIHDRPYQTAWPVEEAVEWIAEQKNRKFDPTAVAAFLRTELWTALPLLEDAAAPTDLLNPFAENFRGASGEA